MHAAFLRFHEILNVGEHAGTRAEMLLNHLVAKGRRRLEFKVVEVTPALHVRRLSAFSHVNARFSAMVAEEDFFFYHKVHTSADGLQAGFLKIWNVCSLLRLPCQ